MIVIPAIDLMNGKVVRLKQGKKDSYTVYSSSPVDVALEFESMGAKRIHVVDLDKAFGEGNNEDVIMEMAKHLTTAMLEVGGGIRSREDVEKALCCRAQRVVIGTMPIKQPHLFEEILAIYGNRIIVAVDVEDGFVKIAGWEENSKADHIAFIYKLQQMGVREVLVTDIKRDGTLEGVDIDFYKNITLKTELSVIASGGVKNHEDIEKLSKLESYGLTGVVLGRAIYEKTVDIKYLLERYR